MVKGPLASPRASTKCGFSVILDVSWPYFKNPYKNVDPIKQVLFKQFLNIILIPNSSDTYIKHVLDVNDFRLIVPNFDSVVH